MMRDSLQGIVPYQAPPRNARVKKPLQEAKCAIHRMKLLLTIGSAEGVFPLDS
jgi:hypothetical protein